MAASKKHYRCCVLGCNNEHKSLHRLPTSEPLRTEWLQFVYEGNIPEKNCKVLYVCANHFTFDSFTNMGQFNAGFLQRLMLKEGSKPTLHSRTATEELVAEMHLKLVCQLPLKHQRRIATSVTINPLVTLTMSTRSSKVSAKRCAVSCCGSRTSLHKLPKDPDERKKWIQFIFKECPTQVDPELRVCSVHFSNDCFENKAQYDASFAKKLLLKDHAVPTVLDPTETPQSSPSWSERKKDVSCQTDAPSRRTVRTQLSHRTVLSYRSKGTQTQPLITTGVDSTKHPTTLQSSASTPSEDKKPCSEVEAEAEKESEAEVEEEVEVEAEDGIEVEEERVCETQEGHMWCPETDSSRLSMETTEGADEDKKYVVFESCLLELFETCPVCTRACDVQHISTETFVAFDQLCPHCHYFRQWKSQLIP